MGLSAERIGVDAWPFRHPPFGTCDAECSAFGTCHCGCGRTPRLARASFGRRSQIKGRPYVFAQGHHVRILHPRAAPFSRCGADIQEVRPMIFLLRDHHGTIRGVAESLRLPEATVRGYAYKQELKRVPPDPARMISRAVLALRGGPRVWNEWE